MPTYEYHCEDCGETFDRTEHINDHADAHPRCPHCNSDKVRQVLSAFYAKTGKKS